MGSKDFVEATKKLRSLHIELENEISEARAKQWQSYLENLKGKEYSSFFYKRLRKCLNKSDEKCLLYFPGSKSKLAKTEQENAEVWVNHFSNVSSHKSFPPYFDQKFKELVDKRVEVLNSKGIAQENNISRHLSLKRKYMTPLDCSDLQNHPVSID